MDAKELTEAIKPIPAKIGENVLVIVRRVEAHFYVEDVPEIKDSDTGKILQPAVHRGDFEHVLVELRSVDGRRFTKTAKTPTACRKLWARATGIPQN